MGSGKEIEEAVLRLSAVEFVTLLEWFAEFDSEVWDRQIEDDVAAGRLNALAKLLTICDRAVAPTGEIALPVQTVFVSPLTNSERVDTHRERSSAPGQHTWPEAPVETRTRSFVR